MQIARVLLAEDHPHRRQALVSMLAETFDVVSAVKCGDQVPDAATEIAPDAIVEIVSLPGRKGLQRFPELREHLPFSGLTRHTLRNHVIHRSEAVSSGEDRFVSRNVVMEPARAMKAASFQCACHNNSPAATTG